MHVVALLVASLFTAAAPSEEILKQYRTAAASVGHSPEANLKLALWCEQNGLDPEREKHLSMVIVADPNNAIARGLLGQVQEEGKWRTPSTIAERAKKDPAFLATQKEYASRRAKAANTADDQWKLALWCEKCGLTGEATAHFLMVLRQEPNHAGARKRLGFKKQDGRWYTDAELSAAKKENAAQDAANRRWKPLLEKLASSLERDTRRSEAEQSLDEIVDPRAIPSILQVFGRSKPAVTVRLLGQIDDPAASRMLALFAISSRDPEIRRQAVESLRSRDLREWSGPLVLLLSDPIKYELKQPQSPDQPVELFVEGERYDRRRIYRSPTPVSVAPEDRFVGFDANGLPIFARTTGVLSLPAITLGQLAEYDAQEAERMYNLIMAQRAFQFAAIQGIPQMSPATADQVRQTILSSGINHADKMADLFVGSVQTALAPTQENEFFFRLNFLSQFPAYDMSGNGLTNLSTSQVPTWATSVTRTYRQDLLMNPALAAEGRRRVKVTFENDVQQLESFNRLVESRNAPIVAALSGGTGTSDLAPTRAAWYPWWMDQMGYRLMNQRTANRPVMVEVIDSPSPIALSNTPISVGRMSCFGAGTLVKTLDGQRPIESIAVGDRVLSQDPETGVLSYQPVLVVHHNPPSATLMVKVGDEPIIASTFHRFWLAGHGWKMARELKNGDPIRTLDGREKVVAVEPEKAQPVFNLDVAGGHTFFVGKQGALVHDNSVPATRHAVFDAVDTPASLASSGKE